MLLTKDQSKYLEDAGEGKFKFAGKDKATKKEKEQLLELDSSYYDIYNEHIIVNIDDLEEGD